MIIWRFIPAGAGNTSGRRPPMAFMTVHPRRRGEHGVSSISSSHPNGSSPQARGTHLRAEIREYANRFIPAGAGNTY